jgi:hypothetical protein
MRAASRLDDAALLDPTPARLDVLDAHASVVMTDSKSRDRCYRGVALRGVELAIEQADHELERRHAAHDLGTTPGLLDFSSEIPPAGFGTLAGFNGRAEAWRRFRNGQQHDSRAQHRGSTPGPPDDATAELRS